MEAVTARSKSSFEDSWEYDFIWNTSDGPVAWDKLGRVTDMGHAEFLEGGVDKRDAQDSPFTTLEQVYEFDAMKEYSPPPMDEAAAFFEKRYQDIQTAHPNQVVPGGYYKTLVSGAIQSFGWDAFLLALADQERFEAVLDSFFRLSLHYYTAWAKTSIKAFICHDDMVWTEGAFISPDFYRRAIFPRYKKLWDVLKSAGKKVLYCSDGNYTEFIDDIAESGADGFIFEPVTSLETIVERYGKTHVIVGSKVDCRTLTFGTKEDIKKEIDETLKLTADCPGHIFTVGNHITHNISIDNAEFYIEYLKHNWSRE
jgi:uroporphyrinogen decarboxylase